MDTAALTAILQQHGVRPTPQRLAVYDYLLTHRTHPSADVIYAALSPVYPSFSRTTIYNSLRALEETGLIRLVTIDPQEQHFDGNPADHGHFRCSRCGKVYDFDFDPKTVTPLAPPGFTVSQQDIFLTGICPSCDS